MSLIKEQATQSVIDNPDIPNEKNEAVMAATGSSIISSLQGMLSQGNVKDVMSLFSNPSQASSGSPAVQQMSGNLLETLTGKLGLNSQQAGGIVSSLLPAVLGSLVSRTNNPADNGFSLQGIFNQLSGGNTAGMDVQGMFNKFSAGGGLDRDGDGDVDLNDLKAAFAGGGTSAGNAQPGGGGLLDSLKGLFGG
ncbi:hypothetical protein FPE01S_07_00640 [Flavihumibacter petaseus NBRC 106054]|uniref:EF-hand domain-containing protein n=2 Tax=Flavihumibacter TaxID=1004301 RepID=A0A0E9N7I5_9BACT|nr:hypothetical protein FPE01S_07_00640 [Flavihumibacter petaseus NBRC 106054]